MLNENLCTRCYIVFDYVSLDTGRRFLVPVKYNFFFYKSKTRRKPRYYYFFPENLENFIFTSLTSLFARPVRVIRIADQPLGFRRTRESMVQTHPLQS